MSRWICTIGALALAVAASNHLPAAFAQETPALSEAEQKQKDLEVLQERSGKIVDTLGIEDPAKATQVRDIIVDQYFALRVIHADRDAALAAALEAAAGEGLDKAATDEKLKAVREAAQAQATELNNQFVKTLESQLSPEQVDKVKDGMTYSVAPGTYRVYIEMYPMLTDEQKQFVHDRLYEARELAMTGGSSKEKHDFFGKAKGKINNYISRSGINMKEAAAAFREREKAKQQQQQQQ